MSKILEISQTDAAYIAGIIDGEGLIYLNRQKGERYLLKLDVKNTSKTLLDWLRSTTGDMGSMRLLKKRGNRQPCYEWRLTPLQAHKLLKTIRPFIRAKCDQVAVAIEYQELPREQRLLLGSKYQAALKAMHLPALRTAAGSLIETSDKDTSSQLPSQVKLMTD